MTISLRLWNGSASIQCALQLLMIFMIVLGKWAQHNDLFHHISFQLFLIRFTYLTFTFITGFYGFFSYSFFRFLLIFNVLFNIFSVSNIKLGYQQETSLTCSCREMLHSTKMLIFLWIGFINSLQISIL